MLKLVFYIGLTAVGVIATLINPIYGAVTCIEAYLLNPVAIVGESGIRFQLLATGAFFLSVLIHRRKRSDLPATGRYVLLLLWLFVTVGALSASWAVFSGTQALNNIWEVAKTLLMASLLVAVVRNERDARIVITAGILGAFHAAFMHTLGIKWGYVYGGYAKEIGVLPDGQTPAMILFLPVIIVTAAMGATKKERILSWLVLPFVLDSIVSTYMRTGFVSLGVEALLLMLFLPKRIVLRLSPALAVGALLFVYRLTPDDYWQRVETIEDPHAEASANSRFIINGVSWRMLMDYPMGVGYGNYGDVSPKYLPPELLTGGRRSAHNSYFSVACETGWAGFAIWISAFAGAILLCRRVRKSVRRGGVTRIEMYAMGIEIGLYGWLAGGCFQADHEVDPAYWFAGLAIVLARIWRQRQIDREQGEPALVETPAVCQELSVP